MSAAPKRNPRIYPNSHKQTNDSQENMRLVKIESEQIKEQVEKRILDNPKIAKKAALILSLWLERAKKTKK